MRCGGGTLYLQRLRSGAAASLEVKRWGFQTHNKATRTTNLPAERAIRPTLLVAKLLPQALGLVCQAAGQVLKIGGV